VVRIVAAARRDHLGLNTDPSSTDWQYVGDFRGDGWLVLR
jgi:hypothetical protein